MRVRLREKYSDDKLREIYAAPHSHDYWYDHRVRVQASIGLIKAYLPLQSVADLSAGDATIINALDIPEKHIGDYAPGYQYRGAIEDTIYQIPKVDLFICSETLEHLDNPDGALMDIRNKTKWLLLTTPIGENDNRNPEHYWGWDEDGVYEMLTRAGFTPEALSTLKFYNEECIYRYQMWVAR